VVDVNGGVLAALIVAVVLLLVLGSFLWLWLRSAREGGAAPLAVDALDQTTGAPTQLAADAARAQAAAAALDPRSLEQAMESTVLDEMRATGPTDDPEQRP
jgi:hypothetical protein